jgi:hypothetical protein
MYQLIIILKAINEIALLSLLAQGVMFLFAGAKRDSNVIYFIFKTITSPVMKLARAVYPAGGRSAVDRGKDLFLSGSEWSAIALINTSEATRLSVKIAPPGEVDE